MIHARTRASHSAMPPPSEHADLSYYPHVGILYLLHRSPEKELLTHTHTHAHARPKSLARLLPAPLWIREVRAEPEILHL